jgi:hypothetical protein
VSTTDIVQAAFEKLDSFEYEPQPEILWPGKQEKPPDSGMWLEPKVFPNEPDDIAWDNDSCVDTRGWFQILVYFRPGQGVLEPGVLADALIDFFPKGSALANVRVRKRPWQSPVVTDKDKLFIPVTIPYRELT